MPNAATAHSWLDDSILITIRPLNNVDKNDNSFDEKLIPYANAQIMEAHELGVGYDDFQITGSQQTFRDWLGDAGSKLSGIATWLGLSVLLIFDPPDNASQLQSIQRTVDKFTWHLRSKSWRSGAVKEYVPDQAQYYDSMMEAIVDE